MFGLALNSRTTRLSRSFAVDAVRKVRLLIVVTTGPEDGWSADTDGTTGFLPMMKLKYKKMSSSFVRRSRKLGEFVGEESGSYGVNVVRRPISAQP